MIREATVQAMEYWVCAYPDWEDDPDGEPLSFMIWVRRRLDGRWVVKDRLERYLSMDGTWDRPTPGDGTDETWRDTHGYDLATALCLAKEAAPHLTISGRSIDEHVSLIATLRRRV